MIRLLPLCRLGKNEFSMQVSLDEPLSVTMYVSPSKTIGAWVTKLLIAYDVTEKCSLFSVGSHSSSTLLYEQTYVCSLKTNTIKQYPPNATSEGIFIISLLGLLYS